MCEACGYLLMPLQLPLLLPLLLPVLLLLLLPIHTPRLELLEQ
jgi:hypothetical protein